MWKFKKDPKWPSFVDPLKAIRGLEGHTVYKFDQNGELLWSADVERLVQDFCKFCADNATFYKSRKHRDMTELKAVQKKEIANLRSKHAGELSALMIQHLHQRNEEKKVEPYVLQDNPARASAQAYEAADFPHRKAAERREQSAWLTAELERLAPRPK